jgi:hypothetical protein
MAIVSFMRNKVTFCNISLVFPHNREGSRRRVGCRVWGVLGGGSANRAEGQRSRGAEEQTTSNKQQPTTNNQQPTTNKK